MIKSLFFALFIVLVISINIYADTLGLVYHDTLQAFDGYTLFAPLSYTTTYLIDIDGNLVNFWESDYTPGNSAYLLDNGHLLRTAYIPNSVFHGGGSGGRIQEFDWDGNLVWDFVFSSTEHYSHHDIELMPCGNILVIAWEYKSMSEAIEAGRAPMLLSDSALWPDMIVEIEPTGDTTGNIVWEWHSFDHLVQHYDSTKDNYGVIADNPGKLNINCTPTGAGADWLHINAVDYNPRLDQIAISSREFSEFFVIDHSTANYDSPSVGILAAAGPAGDILYRWGNPENYDMGTPYDQKLFGQHDIQWIEPGCPGMGNFLLFNNGDSRTPIPYSSVDLIAPPMDSLGNYARAPGSAFGPSAPAWTYVSDPETLFYSDHISGAQRLKNGNTLICSGATGRFFEVTPAGETVWEYVNPVNDSGPQFQGTDIRNNMVFRCYRYAPDYAGLVGRDLTPMGPIEKYVGIAETALPEKIDIQIYPNPFNSAVTISLICHSRESGNPGGMVGIEIFDINGRMVANVPSPSVPLPAGEGGKTLLPPGEGGSKSRMRAFIWQPDKSMSSGVYLVRAKLGDEQTKIKRVVYLK